MMHIKMVLVMVTVPDINRNKNGMVMYNIVVDYFSLLCLQIHDRSLSLLGRGQVNKKWWG
jgi:hypothetical protein